MDAEPQSDTGEACFPLIFESRQLEESLCYFSKIAQRFFCANAQFPNNNNHEDELNGTNVDEIFFLDKVLNTYETCKQNPQGKAELLIEANISPEILDMIEHTLQSIGFVQVDGPNNKSEMQQKRASNNKEKNKENTISYEFKYFEVIDQFERAKNEARAAFHAERARLQEATFIRLLQQLWSTEAIWPSSSAPASADSSQHVHTVPTRAPGCAFKIIEAKEALHKFSSQYSKVTLPFPSLPFPSLLFSSLQSHQLRCPLLPALVCGGRERERERLRQRLVVGQNAYLVWVCHDGLSGTITVLSRFCTLQWLVQPRQKAPALHWVRSP